MKNWKTILSAVAMAAMTSAAAYAGEKAGNGGNAFRKYYSGLASEVLRSPKVDALFSERESKSIKTALSYTNIRLLNRRICPRNASTCSVADSLIARNSERDALIEVNPNRFWATSFEERLANSVHEYLGVAGLEKDSFGTTMKVLAEISDVDAQELKNRYEQASREDTEFNVEDVYSISGFPHQDAWIAHITNFDAYCRSYGYRGAGAEDSEDDMVRYSGDGRGFFALIPAAAYENFRRLVVTVNPLDGNITYKQEGPILKYGSSAWNVYVNDVIARSRGISTIHCILP